MTQLELFADSPWSVRLRVPDSLADFFAHDWIKTAKAKNTRKCFRRIGEFWARRFVDEITKTDVGLLREHLSALGLKANTVNTHHTIVTRWFYWLAENRKVGIVRGVDYRRVGLPEENPGSAVRKVNEDQFRRNVAWPKVVVHKLVAAAQRLGDQFMADVIDTLYITKLRPGDVWEMTERNVDFAHKVLQGIQHKSIRRSMPSGLPYVKAITPRLETILRRRVEAAATGAPLFRSPGYSDAAWRRHVGRRFGVLRTFARLPHVNLCDMRPSAATLELDNGVDPLSVSEGLGHTTLRLLPVYARRTLAHQRLAQEKLEDKVSEILK